MKFIRTKDGIYELKETKNGEKYLVKTNELVPLWNKDVYEIINQADTIEELCDRLIIKDSNKKEPIIYNLEKFARDKPLKDFAKTLFITRKVEWVKLAIWTDKGLIYVAKINEKGEIELL